MGSAGLGMREAILDAGTDLVVPSSKRMTYCRDVAGSDGNVHDSARPEDRIAARTGLSNSRTRRVQFADGGSVIAMEGNK